MEIGKKLYAILRIAQNGVIVKPGIVDKTDNNMFRVDFGDRLQLYFSDNMIGKIIFEDEKEAEYAADRYNHPLPEGLI